MNVGVVVPKQQPQFLGQRDREDPFLGVHLIAAGGVVLVFVGFPGRQLLDGDQARLEQFGVEPAELEADRP